MPQVKKTRPQPAGVYPRKIKLACYGGHVGVPGSYITVTQKWPWSKWYTAYVRQQYREMWS